MRTLPRLFAVALIVALSLSAHPLAQNDLAAHLDRAIKAASVAIAGVSIGDPVNKATWKVSPPSLQSAAQPTIDAFNATDPALDAADLDKAITVALDQERLSSAIVWTIIDTYSPPATIAKYNTARTKIISAYKLRPWIP